MDDKKLTDLLRQDHSEPQAPNDEWAKINDRIESKPLLNTKQWMSAVACVAVLIVLKLQITEFRGGQRLDDNLGQYLLEEDYFSQEESLYAWVDES